MPNQKRGPERLIIAGVPCVRQGDPMRLNGSVWDTYVPDSDDDADLYADDGPTDGRIWERDATTGRVIQTRE